eukprot:scaffold13989_cov60-Phaeocystis_antarctica.AAC.2
MGLTREKERVRSEDEGRECRYAFLVELQARNSYFWRKLQLGESGVIKNNDSPLCGLGGRFI